MSTPPPLLPDAKTFMEGTQGIKPHQHAGESLRAFIDGFEGQKLATKAAQTIVQAQDVMAQPEWLEAHNAAHRAITNAIKMVDETPELAREVATIESIYKSQALNPDTLRTVKHPDLRRALEPLESYLKEFQGFLRSWVGLQPGRMKPRTDDAVSPLKHRENLEILKLSAIPDCGDIHCTLDHGAGAKPAFAQAATAAGNAAKSVRRNPGLWVAAASTISLGAYLISKYGERDNSTGMTPPALPGAQERAQDIAYVINHAVSCATTDTFIQPPVGAWVQTGAENGKLPPWLAWVKNIFESHEHHGGSACNHPHMHAATPSSFKGNALHWLRGEIVGDAGAVPLTIFVQRHMPSFMHGLRRLMEPVAGKIFYRGARRSARGWAISEGLNPNGPEAKAREKELYEHEMSHLSLAVVWNAFSVPVNLAVQKLGGSKASLGVMAMGKMFGSLASNTMLIGGRAFTPQTFGALDRFNGKHIVLPISKAFGVDSEAADTPGADKGQQKSWAGRMEGNDHEKHAPRGV